MVKADGAAHPNRLIVSLSVRKSLLISTAVQTAALGQVAGPTSESRSFQDESLLLANPADEASTGGDFKPNVVVACYFSVLAVPCIRLVFGVAQLC